ncbi:MAG: transcriptional regulator [Alistipes sp.]|nr:transcriptional regulator [Alistipes sp.]
MSKSKNDTAWEQLFEKHAILEKISSLGRVCISSADINVFREARLMTKFDHRSQLPVLFARNNLSILPTSRGTYEISTFETFSKFNDDDIDITPIDFPRTLESIDYRDITSEATAINCAYVARILQDFSGEEHLLPTVSGRMSSLSFDFNINTLVGPLAVNVGNAQIEIDGGYEGAGSLILIEAKNYISDDFLVRQLYYPYRLWAGKIRKRVRPVFLTYSNGIFHLREYEFTRLEHYNSIRLVRHRRYSVQQGAIGRGDIRDILQNTGIADEPRLPFPQADSFERVINLCELLNRRAFISKDEITQNYDFDQRQTDYYSNAGKYLGLIENCRENEMSGCRLTPKGRDLFSKPIVERQLEFVKSIVSYQVFNETLRYTLDRNVLPTRTEVVGIMKRSGLYNVGSEETFRRRASTVLSWTKWITGLLPQTA